MSDDKPVGTATAPTDEKAEKPAADAPGTSPDVAPEAVASAEPPTPAPEAEASVEEETTPDPEQAPEPEPAPPPEVAEVAAAVAQLNEQQEAPQAPPEPESATTEALVPVQESVTEALVPVHEPEPAPEPKAEDEPPAAPAKPAKKARSKATKSAANAPAEEPTGTVTATEEPAKSENKKKWYAVKVQSGREDTIKAAILRKVAIEGLEEFFGEIAIPVEEVIEKKQVRVKDKKTGEYTYQEKKVTKKRKKFHGYIFANVEFNDRILYLFRETSGVGDFLNVRGSPGAPVAEPMPEHEVRAMLTGERQTDPTKKPKIKIDVEKGDRVRIREGSFANQEGEVKEIQEPKDPTDSPKIKVILTFWGRPLEVDLDHWQVEKV